MFFLIMNTNCKLINKIKLYFEIQCNKENNINKEKYQSKLDKMNDHLLRLNLLRQSKDDLQSYWSAKL